MVWMDNFFDENYNRSYTFLENKDRIVKEVNFIEKALALSPEHAILDIPCGFGRHAMEFTMRGYNVTGFEYHKVQINKAQEAMEENNVHFPIIQGDIRDIPYENKYDRMYNFFTSFGYFDDETNEKIICQFYKALKKNGLFLMELINRDFLIKDLQNSSVQRLEDGSIVIEERELDLMKSRQKAKKTFIEPDGKRLEYFHDLRVYSAHELINIFEKCGFKFVNVYGDYNFSAFTRESRRLAIVVQKI